MEKLIGNGWKNINNMRKISVIMASCLSPYKNSASNPEKKLIRAINSFLKQTYKNKELIIIADGCRKTMDIYDENFSNNSEICLNFIEKQPLFSGKIRNIGLSQANGEIVCYLDHDDFLGTNHLKIIEENFGSQYDWVYYNDYIVRNYKAGDIFTREVEPEMCRIGTSSFAHAVDFTWPDGYGHDWEVISKFLLPLRYKKIPTPEYYVCHVPGLNIDE